MIGSIVKAKCQELLGKTPEITIDVPTRLAFSIEATDNDFRKIVLPIEGWEVLAISELESGISVDMKPKSSLGIKDIAAEIDELKLKYTELDQRIKMFEPLK